MAKTAAKRKNPPARRKAASSKAKPAKNPLLRSLLRKRHLKSYRIVLPHARAERVLR